MNTIALIAVIVFVVIVVLMMLDGLLYWPHREFNSIVIGDTVTDAPIFDDEYDDYVPYPGYAHDVTEVVRDENENVNHIVLDNGTTLTYEEFFDNNWVVCYERYKNK